ncbi:hypothetical protein Tco_0954089 [Tanacetum coccineum]|uniref:Uncharacterized protein n=1 Tax=Tanacetum coccineum TaxID=301880 RepID=A0ABQ5E4A3_9ASTR
MPRNDEGLTASSTLHASTSAAANRCLPAASLRNRQWLAATVRLHVACGEALVVSVPNRLLPSTSRHICPYLVLTANLAKRAEFLLLTLMINQQDPVTLPTPYTFISPFSKLLPSEISKTDPHPEEEALTCPEIENCHGFGADS